MRFSSPIRRAIGFAAVLGIACCSIATVRAAAPKKLAVVATDSIIGDWVTAVAGDVIRLNVLVGPDGDPHEYLPTPGDSMRLADADLIFENGLGLEPWLTKLCDAAGTRAARVALSVGIASRHVDTRHPDNLDSAIGEVDPHCWQDVSNAIVMVNHVRDALVKLDPGDADNFNRRCDAYSAELKSLDASIAAAILTIPPQRRKLVTSHDSFGYFARRYGMTLECSALESATTDAADPSARQIAEIIDTIKRSGVPVVFAENIQNPKLIERIAADAGVKVGPPLYTDALGSSGSAGDTYLKMMRYNTDTLVKNLKP